MNIVLLKLTTYWRLGLANVLRVLIYRVTLASGLLQKRLPIAERVVGAFLPDPQLQTDASLHSLPLCSSSYVLGWHALPLDTMPAWHTSVLSGQTMPDPQRHWTQIADFNSGVGDIKGVWEVSRMGWVLTFAYNARVSGDPRWVDDANTWLNHWSAHNPANQGPNWKCAQETSLRVLHLAAACRVLNIRHLSDSLRAVMLQHVERIVPTLGYARGQDNNHGTSEAAALFVASAWLMAESPQNPQYRRWHTSSRRYLSERVNRLICADGTFSQYSLTYHRLMLDTLSFAELWRRWLQLPGLGQQVEQRLASATRWLLCFIDKNTGDVPNLGANDGAHVLNFAQVEYRDFRPSAELASQLFLDCAQFDDPGSERLRQLLDLCAPHRDGPPLSRVFAEGGFACLSNSQARCYMHAPHFRFRPGQADLLHVDLWVGSDNLLRDGGTFSYNPESTADEVFPTTACHNTVEFDGRSQMPRLSRFLWGAWPQTRLHTLNSTDECQALEGEYSDWCGARHHRHLSLSANVLTVVDTLTGVKDCAVLRWRLKPGDWQQTSSGCQLGRFSVEIRCEQPLARMAIADSVESRYYGLKQPLPVLEAEVRQNTTITTIIRWG